MGRLHYVAALVLVIVSASTADDTLDKIRQEIWSRSRPDGSPLMPLLNVYGGNGHQVEHRDDDVGVSGVGPLILTPYIESNQLELARVLSQVSHEGLNQVAISYTGFFTVNREFDSNLFFWYVPAKTNAETAPLVLWLQGGPGGSSLFGLFVESGPFQVYANANGEFVKERDVKWTDSYNMIYIDQPAGTGFSFTTYDGFAKNMDDVARDLYEALRQFYHVFPALLANDFYVTGESYAGKYVPAISHKIHTMNKQGSLPKIPLKGLAIGDGLCDPMHQWEYGDYAYQTGLVSAWDRDILHNMSATAKKYLSEGETSLFDAVRTFGQMNDLIVQKSNLSFEYNYLLDGQPDEFVYYKDFLNRPETQKGIHVGSTTYTDISNEVYANLYLDFGRSVVPLVQDLLNNDYKVMIYSGQVDIIIPSTGSENFVNHLDWKCKDEYKETDRSIWRYGNKVAGYAREVGNLKQVLVRNAGHILPFDQPEVAYDMLTRFIEGKPFGPGPVKQC